MAASAEKAPSQVGKGDCAPTQVYQNFRSALRTRAIADLTSMRSAEASAPANNFIASILLIK